MNLIKQYFNCFELKTFVLNSASHTGGKRLLALLASQCHYVFNRIGLKTSAIKKMPDILKICSSP